MATRYENKFTLGNILTVLGMVLAMIVQWNIAQNRIALLENQNLEIRRAIELADTETRRIRPEFENRLRTLENRSGQAVSELTAVVDDMREVKDSLRETNSEIRAALALLRHPANIKP